MKPTLIFLLIAALAFPVFTVNAGSPATTDLSGRLIALDAGHGGTEPGAINVIGPATPGANVTGTTTVTEKDVNLAVVLALRDLLREQGADVVLTRQGDDTISSNKERDDLAVSECQALAGRKCDILVSVHHNGSTDPTHDGTLTIYNGKQDFPLAQALHDSLLQLGETDEHYLDGGYGVTVYDHLVSSLTEAYYITNDTEAEDYLKGTPTTTTSMVTNTDYQVLIGDRVNAEAEDLLAGIDNYFTGQSTSGSGSGNGKGNGHGKTH